MTTIYEYGGEANTAKNPVTANTVKTVNTAKTVNTFTKADDANTVNDISTLVTLNTVNKANTVKTVNTFATVLTDKNVLAVDSTDVVNKVLEVNTVNKVNTVTTANTVNKVGKERRVQTFLVHAPHHLVQFGPQERLQCKWPLVVLLDPTPNREDTALQLARTSGLAIVAINSSDPAALGRIVDAIAPLPIGENLGWLCPEALVLEAQHPVGAPPYQPNYALSANDIVDWLAVRGLYPLHTSNQQYKYTAGAQRIPMILYTAHNQTLSQVQALQDFAVRSETPELLRFAGVVSRNQLHHTETLQTTLLNLISRETNPLTAGGE